MENSKITLQIGPDLPFDQIIDLYNSVGWVAYTNEENRLKLMEAIQNSSYVVTAWDGEKLIGLARGLSDDVSIFYLQDIVIHPEYQGQGLGKMLLANCLARYEHVRMKVLMTDDEEKQLKFYEAMGYRNTKHLKNIELNAFVQIKGMELD